MLALGGGGALAPDSGKTLARNAGLLPQQPFRVKDGGAWAALRQG
jgi:hypothetical protein